VSAGPRAVLAVVLATALLRPAVAPAAGSPRVALLSAAADDPLTGRIEAELRAVGFQVTRAVIPADVPVADLVDAQLAGGARAAVIAGGQRTDVWIADQGTARVALHQELEVGEGSDPQSVLALRTLEFLRISLGLGTPPPPAPAVKLAAPPPPPPVVVQEARAPRTTVAVSSGVLASAGGVGPFAVAGVALRTAVAGRFGAELCGYAPLNDSAQSNASGTAQTAVWLVGGGIFLASRGERRWAGEVGAGALAAILTSTGAPAAGDVGATDRGVGAVLYGRAAAKLRLGRAWALRLDLVSGAAVRRPVVTLAGQDVASWGRPFVAALAGGELGF
jgi:hypothetical protein